MRAGFARFGLSFVMLCVQWLVLVLLAGVFRTPIATVCFKTWIPWVLSSNMVRLREKADWSQPLLYVWKRSLRAKGRINWWIINILKHPVWKADLFPAVLELPPTASGGTHPRLSVILKKRWWAVHGGSGGLQPVIGLRLGVWDGEVLCYRNIPVRSSYGGISIWNSKKHVAGIYITI